MSSTEIQTDTPAGDDASLDAVRRLEALREEFQNAEATEPADEPAREASPHYRRYLKTAIAAVLAVLLGWVPISRLLVTSSAEATVNARLITLRAPIDGEITKFSTQVESGQLEIGTILSISNARTDRSHLDELQKVVVQMEAERGSLKQRHVLLSGLLQSMRQQAETYKKARTAQLMARVAELKADIVAADAQVAEAKATLDRTSALLQAGYQPDATYKKHERDFKVLTESAQAARSRLSATEVELAAARSGIFVGDSYNDTPQSSQRAYLLDQQIGELAIDLENVETRLAQAREALAKEQISFGQRNIAEIALPKRGRIWERLVTAGEQVRQGQELLRVLDCGEAVVTATVSEGNYNKLEIGDPADFSFRNGSEEYRGWIVGLNGLSAVPGNFAIDQRAMVREPFHVSVYVPELTQSRDCGIGRSGRVVFSKPEAQSIAAARFSAPIR